MTNKEATIVLRVSTGDKDAIKVAADAAGKSLTSFIVDAALRQSKRAPAGGVHGGVPTWFRAICVEAANGGGHGYESAGWRLAASVSGEMPHDIDTDGWIAAVATLNALLADKDHEGAWGWFHQHYPKFVALVPARRRGRFMLGVQRAFEDEQITV